MIEAFLSSFENYKEQLIQISPEIVIGLLILIFFIFTGIFLRSIARKRLIRHIQDQLLVNFIGRTIFLVFLIIGILLFLNQIGLGNAAGGLLAGAGVSAIIIGFAFKDIGENFIAGFFLAFSRPFSISDVVEVEQIKGVVKALNFRNTHIRTFDGKDIYVPNSILIKNPLINYTRDGLQRFDFTIGLDYGDNITEACKLIQGLLLNEKRIEHADDLAPFIMLKEFATSTINIQIFYWVNSFNFTGPIANLKTEVMYSIIRLLADKGFSLPADIVELKIYQEGQPIPIIMKN